MRETPLFFKELSRWKIMGAFLQHEHGPRCIIWAVIMEWSFVSGARGKHTNFDFEPMIVLTAFPIDMFKTEINTWMIIRVPFQECLPVFRGRILDNVEPIAPRDIQQIGFLISDKQAGPFKLEIDWMKTYK